MITVLLTGTILQLECTSTHNVKTLLLERLPHPITGSLYARGHIFFPCKIIGLWYK
jgi:hypothetical protein